MSRFSSTPSTLKHIAPDPHSVQLRLPLPVEEEGRGDGGDGLLHPKSIYPHRQPLLFLLFSPMLLNLNVRLLLFLLFFPIFLFLRFYFHHFPLFYLIHLPTHTPSCYPFTLGMAMETVVIRGG
ncbi:hypothetical protein L211DRAFT_39985 [Terfezia boudieri ATCC MYA-4762]|uniref:Uncharacterized protein n=1 Tax=Terfezia boudieri ATCC MYA-4762 TaxID=1051890 RepID=A0A3N4M3M4_9PEZI|nr:hypothetical protein L211DRAFT_39985 [Terfezia boudieri ATCC MYA-4762]